MLLEGYSRKGFAPMVLDVLPRSAAEDAFHAGFGQAKPVSERGHRKAASRPKTARLNDLFRCDFGAVSSLLDHISDIVGLGPLVQMVWVAAKRRVALMQNAGSVQWSVRGLIRNAMNVVPFLGERNLPVSLIIFGTRPDQAVALADQPSRNAALKSAVEFYVAMAHKLRAALPTSRNLFHAASVAPLVRGVNVYSS